MRVAMFFVAAGLLRREKDPKFEADTTSVDAHTGVAAADTLSNAESVTFDSAEDACAYCHSDSFTKKHIIAHDDATGQSSCICMAFPQGAKFDMFCGAPNQFGYAKDNGACLCNHENMEQMGATTCDSIP